MKLKFWQVLPQSKKKYVWIGCCVLILAAIFLRFYFEILNVIGDSQISSWKKTHSADCGVVLTGGTGRIREGLDLLYNKQIGKVIISGVNSNSRLKEIVPSWPFYGDLSEEDIILEKRSETTFGNAVQSLVLVEALQCRDILLITSHLHMYRSLRTFKAVYPKKIDIISHSIVGNRYQPSVWEICVEATKSLFYSVWAYSW